MQELLELTGMVLKAEPIGEYDKRVVLLTAESGKITCFAKGARRMGNRFLAATDPFCFGSFRLFPGRNSYSLNEAEIRNYFAGLREDYEGACYGMYFLELSDYYTMENNDERPMLALLYRSVEALLRENIPNRLVRCVFELKALMLNGEYGVVNAILLRLHLIDSYQSWLGTPKTAMLCIVIADSWKMTPLAVIFFLAALQ